MSQQIWTECVTNQQAAGTLFNTYTTAKTVINQQALFTLPPSYLQAGKIFRVKVQGGVSNVVTAQPTFTFQVMHGSIVVHTSGAIPTTTTAHTLIPFDYEVDLRCDTVGAGTTARYLAQGILRGRFVYSGATADPVDGSAMIMCPNTAPAVGTGFESTIANIWDFWVGIQTSNAGNGIQVYNYRVEALN